MRRPSSPVAVLAVAASLCGGATAQPAPTPTVREIMRNVVNPAAELFWKAGGEVDTEEGAVQRAPTPEDAARWTAALDAATTLQGGGARLTAPGVARDADQWVVFSKQLADAGTLAVAAAKARDGAKTFEAGSALYDACYGCHAKYIPRPANSLYKQRTPDDAFKPPT